MNFRKFLEETPPLVEMVVSTVFERTPHRVEIESPTIQLYCPGKDCRGLRFHTHKDSIVVSHEGRRYVEKIVAYWCKNCKTLPKTYALRIATMEPDSKLFRMMKIGEYPRFGEPRPDIVTDVLDDEIKYFEYGYRAETDGLGIGAFAYYRRFVESHKNKIISEIRKVAIAQNLSSDLIGGLDRALARREFSAAVEEIKDAIPDSLKFNGANPLTLLHSALSGGLHNEDDVDCLSIAKDIRTVLTALAERTSELLKGQSALSAAVTRLNQRNSNQKKP